MATYLDLPITTDTASLADEAYAFLEDAIPGWEAAPGNLDALIIEACARIATESRFVAAQVPVAIFRYLGQNIAGLEVQGAAAASGVTTWTAVDTAGHVIPEGTEIAVMAAGEWLGFATTADAEITAGNTQAAGVAVQATAAGSRYNGISGAAELASAIVGIAGVELTAPTAGGTDPETDADYLAALVALFRLNAPRPILAADFAALAVRVAGAERAAALDDTDPATAPTPAARSVTVAVTDADGEPVGQAVADDVDTALQGQREANFQVFVIEPDYSTVDVAVTVAKRPGFDDAYVEAAVAAELEAWLSPATWGQGTAGDNREREWTNERTVRLYDAATVAARADGVQHVAAITLNGQAADYVLGIPTPANRGGETDTTGWDTTGAFLASGGTLTRDTGQHSEGAASFKLAAGGTQYRGLGAPCQGTFRAGAEYTLSADVKVTSGATGLALILGDSAAADYNNEPITATSSWVRYASAWTPSAARTAVRAVVRVETAAASTFYVDNVLVTAAESASLITLPRAGAITVTFA